MYATHPPRPLLWRAFAANSAVLAAALVLLAVTPATVSFPIAVAEGLVLLGGFAGMLGLNLALLQRALAPQSTGFTAPELAAVDLAVDRRLLVCWNDPRHLSADEAAGWAAAELRPVLAAEGIETARLTRLRSASARYGKSFDWLLELDIAEARAHVDSPAWSEWLSDLRMLGLRPGAMVAGRGHVVTPEAE